MEGRNMVGVRRESIVERVVHGAEDHIARWRREEAVRQGEVDANRAALWAETTERANALNEAIARESASARATLADQFRVVYVVASDEVADALQSFSPQRERLVNVMPASEHSGGTGLRGSWLIFESVE
jgi:hypothetical protein